jgi:hypothetical protein
MSKRKKAKHKRESFIPVQDAAHAMRISLLQMRDWIRESKLETTDGPLGLLITESAFKKMAHSTELADITIQATINEARRRQSDNESGLAKNFTVQISQIILEYRSHLGTLQHIHSKYKEKYNILHNQTADVAAYILHARAISLLRMACLCLENHYWESLLFLRPVDEALQLAEYFVISARSPEGKEALLEWFRENKSPSNSVCRDAIDKFSRTLSPHWDNDKLANAMNKIYHAKSKPVHNALNNIMETYQTFVEDGKLIDGGFDYGPCTYPRKVIGLVHFFGSSIWTTVQCFLLCMRLGNIQFEQIDIDALDSLNQRFLKEIDMGREYN